MAAPDETAGGEGALTSPEGGKRQLPLPLAALAEALRSQAEALERIQGTQRQIAETLERGDKAASVIASTRALNETFRGLSDIQRGLLEAVTRGGGRGRGAAATAAIALLSIAAGALLVDRFRGGEMVPAALYRDAQARESEWRGAADRAHAAEAAARERAAALERARDESAAELAALKRERDALAEKAEARSAELQTFLQVKAQADRAATLEIELIDLRRRLRDAEERFATSEKERQALAALLLQEKLDAKSPAEGLLQEAKAKGLMPETPPAPAPGLASLSVAERRAIRNRLNRLLQAAPGGETYDLIDFGAMRDGVTLLDVRIGCYEGPRLLNSIEAKELEVFVDAEADTVELRMASGAISSVRRPGEKVPFADGRHSVFVRNAGVRDWLAQVSRSVASGAGGRLTWKTGPP
jgi:hypothetical protein